jgi:CSLREA domain-containing protein
MSGCELATLAAPDGAAAAVFVVTSTADTSDSTRRNGVCAASGNVCTPRAAIQEANARAGADTIQFAIGSGVQTILLNHIDRPLIPICTRYAPCSS